MMTVFRQYLLMTVTLVLLIGCWLPSVASANNPVILPMGSFNQSITPYVSMFEDTSAVLRVEDVVQPEIQSHFTPIHTRYLKMGLTDSVIWLRLNIYNPENTSKKTALTLSNGHIRDITLFNVLDSKKTIQLNSEKLKGTFSQAHPFVVNIAPQTTSNYLIRISTDAVFNTSIELKSIDQFVDAEQKINMITGIIIGWILIAFLYFTYSLFNYGGLISYAGVLYTLSITLFIPAWLGNFYINCGISRELALYIELISLSISAIAQLMAIISLGWKSLLIQRVLITLIGIQVLYIFAIFWISTGVAEFAISASIVVNELVLISILILGKTEQRTVSKYLLYGAVAVTLCLSLTILNDSNMLSFDWLTYSIVFLLPLMLIMSLLFADYSNHRAPVLGKHSNEARLSPELLSQLSHEMRTPINGVLGMYELLGDTPLSSSQRDYLDTIDLAGRDMLILADEISDLSKVRQHQLKLASSPIQITSLLNKTMSHFQQEAIRKQVELVLDISDSVPDRLLGDRSRLRVLVHNLISRTLAYTEYGELALSASYYQGSRAQGLRLQIQLTGNIVKQDELKSLFSILQPDITNIDEDNPRLWNLIVVRHLIRQMKGLLDVENMTSSGASLTLFLPLEPDPDTTHDDPSDANFKGNRVLIVDDNASLRSVLEKQLKRWGVRADSTYSGREALAMMRNQSSLKEPYDFIIIDHDMPIMSGLQLAEKLRHDEEIQPRPATLMLTGMSISSVENAARSAGIDYIIAKPASGNHLRDALSKLAAQRRNGF